MALVENVHANRRQEQARVADAFAKLADVGRYRHAGPYQPGIDRATGQTRRYWLLVTEYRNQVRILVPIPNNQFPTPGVLDACGV